MNQAHKAAQIHKRAARLARKLQHRQRRLAAAQKRVDKRYEAMISMTTEEHIAFMVRK